MSSTKTFKKFSSAKAHALANNNAPIIRIAGLYIVVENAESFDQIEMIHPARGHFVATVGLGHFERLGNANHAKGGSAAFSGDKFGYSAGEPVKLPTVEISKDSTPFEELLEGGSIFKS